MSHHICTCLWFDGNGEQAALFYTSLFPDSRIEQVFRPEPDAPALTVDFTLCGAPYRALNGGPQYKLSEAVSISVLTHDQNETDRLWHALTKDSGREGRCGWLTDRFGLSWQVVPEALPRLLSSSDRAAAGRAMKAMLQMQTIDIAKLEAAFEGMEVAD